MRTTSRRDFLAGLGLASIAAAGPALGTSSGSGGAAAAGEEFLMAPGLLHFNTGTTGASPRAVVDAVVDATRRFETNPPMQAYRAAPDTLLGEAEAARARCAAFLGCTPAELLLTHGTTDAMNTVASAIDFAPGDRVLTSSLEHEGGVACWRWLGRTRGVALDVVALEPDLTDADEIVRRFEDAITPRTRVLSVSHILAWTGLVMPVAAICAMARRHGVLTVIDGAQASGQVPVDVAALGCDAWAGSGHKWLLGPKGTGFLAIRADPAQRIWPMAWAAPKAPRLNIDSMGICPLPLVIGLDVAVARLAADGLARVMTHNASLHARLHAELATLPAARVVGPPPGPLAGGMIAFTLPAARNVDALRATLLARHRILVRVVDPAVFHGLRISAHVYNDDAQVDALLDALRAELA
jgi:selenocysteine lyase/cysteine desulfurase